VKLYAYGLALAAILALLGAAGHKVYEAGKEAQRKEDAKPIAAAKAAQKTAETQRDQLAAAVILANQIVDAEKLKAAQQAAQAAKAVATATANARDADRTLQAWMAKYARTARDPDCEKTLQEQLCAAVVSDY
jgi:DNA-binding protein H-NS